MAHPLVRFFCCLVLLLMQRSAFACLWDSDTLASEAKGIPEVIQVITGRFERNPPLYYEMRLKRVTAELASQPDRLDLYDDASVACDRLGKSDEALKWSEKKRRRLQTLPPEDVLVRDHWYRYYANAGTFHAHKWIRSGAHRDNLNDLKLARDLITKAIKINPNAHFGREKYQLKAIDWLIAPPRVTPETHRLPNLLTESNKVQEAAEAVKGLTGLIVLGNAWESVDIFNALSRAIQSDDDRSSAAYMARLRACELIDQGQKSLIPTAPSGEKLKALVMGREMRLRENLSKEVEENFSTLRSEANRWHTQRTAYMMARLQVGKHPDTDPHFWLDYKETVPPEIRASLLNRINSHAQLIFAVILLSAFAIVLVAVLFLFWLLLRRRRAFLSGRRG